MFSPVSRGSGCWPTAPGRAEPSRLLEPCVWRGLLRTLHGQGAWAEGRGEGGRGPQARPGRWAVECYGSFQQDGDVSDTQVWECEGPDLPESRCECPATCRSPSETSPWFPWAHRGGARAWQGTGRFAGCGGAGIDPVSEAGAHVFLKAATEDSCPRLSFESYPSVEDRGGLPWCFANQGFIVFPRRKPQLYLISI